MVAPTTSSETPSRWRASPARLAQLAIGLFLFGAGEACIIRAQLGNSPWTVLAQGASEHVGVEIGVTTIVLSFLILLAWIPLAQRPGLGTIANAVLVGVSIDVVLGQLSAPSALGLRLALVFGGIALIAIGSSIYLGVRLGPGPRDGLMTGIHRRFGTSVRAARFGVEGSALVVGFVLGGTVGIGTVLFAVLIGPAVQVGLGVVGTRAADL